MKRWLTILTGMLLLLSAMFGTGCAPMPYQGHYPEVIVIYEPVPYPYPDTGPVCKNPPPRHEPLVPAKKPGNPRTKTPRQDRTDDRATVIRTKTDKTSLAQQAGHQPKKRTGFQRR